MRIGVGMQLMKSKRPAIRDKLGQQIRANSVKIGVAAALAVISVALLVLHGLLADVRAQDVGVAFRALSTWQVALALGLTAISYLLLTIYDVLALAMIGKKLPYRTAALASFTSYTLSHNLGLSLLTGGSARYRIYSAAGLAPSDIARIVASTALTFWAGVVISGGAALALHTTDITIAGLVISSAAQRGIGLGVLALTGGILMLLRTGFVARLGRWSLPLPSPGQALAQITIAAVDLAAASAALFVLLPDAAAFLFPVFFLAYVLAIIVALISHVPGGVGVFEAVIIATLPTIDHPGLLAALVAYRAIYYLLPLFVAAILLGYHERTVWRQPLSDALDATRVAVASVAPMLLAALAFVGGSVLLVSGSLPAMPDRLRLLHAIVPLPFVEASHIAASLAGTGLLLLAPGLYRRLDGAFLLTRSLLVGGAVFSLIKGIDYEEMIVLLAIGFLLQWMRPVFYRHTRLTQDALSVQWIATVAMGLGLSIWIGMFAFKHVDYQDALWWDFA